MTIQFRILLCFAMSLMAIAALGQRGPGGVTDDSDQQKNCRLWLDAGDLNLADGAPVNVWYDKSISDIQDSAFWDESDINIYLQPLFRNVPSAGINGKPVISFQSGGMLSIGKWDGNNSVPPSADLNSNANQGTTYEQTMFFAFRTANDVTSKQIIWEEGGSNRGISIYIFNSEIYIGAYDDIGIGSTVNNNFNIDGDGVPAFGFTYRKLPVQPNTTYILSYVYDVPLNGNLITNLFNPDPSQYSGLTGTLNGQSFTNNMITGCCQANGVGGIATHPDPIGIGGLNRTSYDELGPIFQNANATGTRLFTGRLAEICYYAFAVNPAERIIIENYLAAKYFANVIANDKYQYEAEYGDGVIGIGRQQPGVEHNVSQGDNLFEISVSDMNTAFNDAPKYLHIGHNNSSITWTNQNTPDSSSVQRLRRIWRADLNGGSPNPIEIDVKLEASDIAKLPPLPSGYSKYGILIESESNVVPNFSASNSEIIELANFGSGPYETSINVKKGSFLTICAIKPTINFENSTENFIELDPLPNTSPLETRVMLNYTPTPSPLANFDVGYRFVDLNGFEGTDYIGANGTSEFDVLSGDAIIPFEAVNNLVVDPSPVKDFMIILDPLTTDPDVQIGVNDTLIFSIYDDDPDPKITFTSASNVVSESAGLAEVRVSVLGNTSDPTTLTLIRANSANSGTATYGVDYTLPSNEGWINAGAQRRLLVDIPAGLNEEASVFFPITDDIIDEFNETIILYIQPTSVGVGVGDGSIIEHTLTIMDDDPEPTVSFQSGASEGFESISEPRIYVNLNAPSEKEVIASYTLNPAGTATPDPEPNGDFAVPAAGDLFFPPGVTELFIAPIVYGNDEIGEPDETIIFDLDNDPVNAVLGSIDQHVYTIKEYSEFEWQGLAGVGKLPDNTFWMVPDARAAGSNITSVPNLSPRPVEIFQNENNAGPNLTTKAAGQNNHQLLDFNGTNDYMKVGGTGSLEGQNSLINSGGLYDNKSLFFVFSPDVVNSSTPQVIYEQGGGTRGMSIYILQNKLYFYIWNGNNDGNFSPWGFAGNSTNTSSLGQAYIQSTTNLQAGELYIVSCHYSRNYGIPATNSELSGMSMYINGSLEGTFDGLVGRLYTHTGRAALGAAWHQTKIHSLNSTGPSGTSDKAWFFNGKIGEFLYMNEPNMNEARIQILHNYFSALYNLELDPAVQSFDLAYANNTNATNPDFNYDVAGIAQINQKAHGDSQGYSELRIRDPKFSSTSDVLMTWGHNGEELTNTWPFIYDGLPNSVVERSGRIWRFSNENGGIDSVQVRINFSTSGNAGVFSSSDPSLLRLLVHQNSTDPQDFSSATVYMGTVASGNIAVFENVIINDGSYIALGNISSSTPLPIELLSFDAKLKGTYVDLNWSTATELNNDYFVVERAGEDLLWEPILEKAGAGNSNSLISYSDKDRNPLRGVSYYRLKQVDFDGSFSYSDPVSVFNHRFEDREEVFMYPNPSAMGSVFLRLPFVTRDFRTEVKLFDLKGRQIRSERFDTNAEVFEFKYGKLTPGIYLLYIESDAINETKKVIIE